MWRRKCQNNANAKPRRTRILTALPVVNAKPHRMIISTARMLLPRRVSGLLVVRRRWMDITILFSLGTAIGVLALVVPPGT